MFQRPFALASCLLVTFLASPTAGAQDPPGGDEKLAFSCLYWEGKPKEPLFYRDGKSMVPLEFTQAARSRTFELSRTGSFELFRHQSEVLEGEPPYKQLASVGIPGGTGRILFLIIPFEGDAGLSYRVVAVDDSLKAFPRGSFQFANFTSGTLEAKFDGQAKKIPPGKLVVMNPGSKPEGGFVPFLIANTQGETLYGTRLFGQPHGRELVFITPSLKEGGAPRVKFISELLAPPPPPP